MIDHALFDPATIDPETKTLNAEIVAAHAAQPDPWSLPIAEVRARRREGTKASPAMPRSARAETLTTSPAFRDAFVREIPEYLWRDRAIS